MIVFITSHYKSVVLIVALLFVVIIMRGLFNKGEKNIINVSGVNRNYYIYSPKNKIEKMPVVIMLHGYSDMPLWMKIYSRMNKKADKEKFIVVYPEGLNNKKNLGRSWNAGFCCGTAYETDSDDISFIKMLVEKLEKSPNIDGQRIYMAGFSNGGMFTHRLASEIKDHVAAVAVVSGSIGNGEYIVPKPLSPIPIIMLHGENDTVIPIKGGKSQSGYIYNSLNDAEKFWVETNKCSGEVNISDTPLYLKRSHINCGNNSEVVTYMVKNRSHIWFGGLLEIKNGNFKNNLSATDEIWNFFKEKRLND